MATNADTKYNGWKNYSTWLVKLELLDTLDDSMAEDIREGHREPFENLSSLADYIGEYVDELIEMEIDYNNRNSSLTLRYARNFVSDCSFWEIAEHMIEDYPELIATEDEQENDDVDE